MKIAIVATEASADFLGFKLIDVLKKRNKNLKLFGIGGQLMESTGFNSFVSIDNFNTIGIAEVFFRIPKFLRILKVIEKKIRDEDPDLIITIDSPSFSYRLVKKLQDLRKKNVKFFHYVAPTVWAWKKYRAKIFSQLYDKMFTLFKFENKYFVEHNLESHFVGHQIFFETKVLKKKRVITFLPGSRNVEIKNNLLKLKSVISYTANVYSDYSIYILTFEHSKSMVKRILKNINVKVITNFDEKQNILSNSYLAIAASGSISLELCKYQVPSIIVYNTHIITRIVIKLFVNVRYASIINIHFDKEIIPEYLFEKFTYNNLIKEIAVLLKNKKKREKQIEFMKKFSNQMLLKKKNPAEIISDYII